MDISHLIPGIQHPPHHPTRGSSAGNYDTDTNNHNNRVNREPSQDGIAPFTSSRPSTPGSIVMNPAQDGQQRRRPRKLVLCFDGTGNKFRGDDSDSNILKIFRMLDRNADDQYHYYQPGIGTYVVSSSLSHTSLSSRVKSWYLKAKDSAVGSSFDQHVVGGYRFLMRFYNPGDEIYIFGFSRGSYIARFLAEMLDYIGLLSHGNEEMIHFAWKAFSQWQQRHASPSSALPESREPTEEEARRHAEAQRKKHEMYEFMKGFRETFSRPVRRIRFLGLFDTVNSVPRFETAWMQRSKFPYTARSSAKVIRHAVSIDERRAKFRQDLMYQSRHGHHHHQHRRPDQVLHDLHQKYRSRSIAIGSGAGAETPAGFGFGVDAAAVAAAENRGRRPSQLAVPGLGEDDDEDEAQPYRRHSRSKSRMTYQTSVSRQDGTSPERFTPGAGAGTGANTNPATSDCCSELSAQPPPTEEPEVDYESEDETEQDVDEVWFAGGHGDVGGGWEVIPGRKSASHVPLVWMVREAMRAGLPFDADKVAAMGCIDLYTDGDDADPLESHMTPSTATADFAQRTAGGRPVPNIRVNSQSQSEEREEEKASPPPDGGNGDTKTDEKATAGGQTDRTTGPRPSRRFHEMMHKAHTTRIHDSLLMSCGLGFVAVYSWKMMEYLPFRRMDLQPDGSWKPIRWPLPCGEVRDIPDNARVHGSVVRRMRLDPSYRPGNLIVGGGGRGCRVAPREYGMGHWRCVAEEGDPIGEVWVKDHAKKLTTSSTADS